MQALIFRLCAIAFGLEVGWVDLGENSACLNKMAVLDIWIHAKNRSTDACTDRVKMAVHLCVIRGFIGREIHPAGCAHHQHYDQRRGEQRFAIALYGAEDRQPSGGFNSGCGIMICGMTIGGMPLLLLLWHKFRVLWLELSSHFSFLLDTGSHLFGPSPARAAA